VQELQVAVAPLGFSIGGKSYQNHLDWRELPAREFYQMLREGKVGSTSAVNPDLFSKTFESFLKEGKDILCLCFSSSLSSTYSSALMAKEELMQKYPDSEICVVDTLSGCLGQGHLVYTAAREKRKGRTLAEIRKLIENIKKNVCHWFMVDDLSHLKRGGRISAATAFLGTILSVKPVLHADEQGHLVNVEKVRGRKAALRALAERVKKTALRLSEGRIYISHADCEEDAGGLADIIRGMLPDQDVLVNIMGPVLGIHAGPGALAVFFLGSAR